MDGSVIKGLIILVLVVSLVVWFFVGLYKEISGGIKRRKTEKEANLRFMVNSKIVYENALRGIDKQEALRAGRIYYGSLRPNGVLTIYDEQALTNDLASMKH